MSADLRVWLFQTLKAIPALTAIVPAASMFGAGSLKGSPKDKPFIVVRVGPTVPGPFKNVCDQEATVYFHDEPGDYMRIGNAINAARIGILATTLPLLANNVSWRGDSDDLSDDSYGTIFRTSTYQLHGRLV